MTLTFESDLDIVKVHQHVTHLGQWSLNSNVTVETHTLSGLTALPGPLKWSVTSYFYNQWPHCRQMPDACLMASFSRQPG